MKRLLHVLLMAALSGACRDRPTPEAITGASGPVADLIGGEPVVLVGAGDIGDCASEADEATAALLDNIPGTIMTVGDNAYPNGSPEDFQNCFEPNWGRHKARIRPATGNHEYHTPDAAGYFAYFGAAAGEPGKGYYSYQLGAWHVVVLNSSIDMSATSAQLAWLRQDLAASDARCTAAYWHHPRFTSTTRSDDTTLPRAAWEALYEAGAEVIVSAHQHHYERFAPQKPGGARDLLYGIRQFVIGTGGDRGESFGPPHPTSEVRDNSSYGVLQLTLDSLGYAWQFVPVPGDTLQDRGTGTCHGPPPASLPPVAVAGGPYTGTGTIRFDGRKSADPDGDTPLTYAWDFGDGRTGSQATPTHTYSQDGTYQVRLTVTDARGVRSTPTITLVTISNSAATPVVLTGAANIARCSRQRGEATARLLDGIDGWVLTAGDNAFPHGAAAEYANCYEPTWGRHRSRTYPALGNHDYDQGHADAAFDYFGPNLGPRGKGYYSFDLRDWHVIVLNDNGSLVPYAAGSEQDQWLVAALAATQKACVLAVWHTPLFLSSNFPNYVSNPSRRTLWERLYQAGADLVISGNQHHYERFAPMRPNGSRDDLYGIRQFNVGTGGESLALPTLAIHPNSEVRASLYGVLKLTLRDGGYDWAFVPVEGETFTDSGSGQCHGVPVNQPPTADAGGPYTTTDGTVHFDGAGSNDVDSTLPLTYQWDFGDGNTNEALRPSHTYLADGQYTVTLTVTDAQGAQSAPATTTATVSRSTSDVVLAGAGNIATCGTNNDEATAKLLDALPGFVVVLGDNAYPGGTAGSYDNCFHPTWGRHRTRTAAVVLGNHEYSAGNADATFDYFGERAGPRGQGYYSFDRGDWHVIVLNDNASHVPYDAGSAQDTWLQADLAANTRRCTIALWHTPLFLSSNSSGYTTNPSRKILWDRLHAAGADIVVNGNQHHYERMAPMTPAGVRDDGAGIRQFNAGTGGESKALPTVAIHPNSEVRASSYGVLRLTLRSDGYDWQFLSIAGDPFTDSGSGTCH
ncbi:MAG TPA: PKD domain-containing protein [Gemmatimonadales bacterium]|nr:PKD domain-containing protein [Gemmatimonadales bacterium]